MRRFMMAMVATWAAGCGAGDGACTISDNGDGTVDLTCPDGSTTTLQAAGGMDPDPGGDTDVAVDTDIDVDTDGSGDTDLPCGPVEVLRGDYEVRTNLDLALLRCVREITGSLTIFETGIDSLAPLGSLTRVGELIILANPDLTDLTGLEALTRVEGTLNVARNEGLTSLQGLGALASVRDLYIEEQGGLSSLAGLESLTTVTRNLSVGSNGGLTNLGGLDSLQTVGGMMDISRNDNLVSLTGLEALTTVGSYFTLLLNVSLTDLDALGALTSVGDLTVQGNASLCASRAEALETQLGASCTCVGNQEGC